MNKVSSKWFDKELKTRQGDLILFFDTKKLKFRKLFPWVYKGKKTNLFFKPQNEINFPDAEIAYSFFAKQLNIRAVEARGAVAISSSEKDFKQGVVTENFIKNQKTQRYITSHDLIKAVIRRQPLTANSSRNTIEDNLEKLKNIDCVIKDKNPDKKIVLDPNLRQDMFKMLLVDFLLFNIDRHGNNYVFIVEERENDYFVSLGSIFDNSLILGLSEFDEDERDKINQKKFRSVLRASQLRFSVFHGGFTPLEVIAEELAEEMLTNKELRILYKKAVKISVDSLEESIKQIIPEHSFDDYFKFCYKETLNYTTKLFYKHFKQAINKQDQFENQIENQAQNKEKTNTL